MQLLTNFVHQCCHRQWCQRTDVVCPAVTCEDLSMHHNPLKIHFQKPSECFLSSQRPEWASLPSACISVIDKHGCSVTYCLRRPLSPSPWVSVLFPGGRELHMPVTLSCPSAQNPYFSGAPPCVSAGPRLEDPGSNPDSSSYWL